MPFNLGGLSSGLVSGYDTGQKWKDRSDQKHADMVWGNTLASLGVNNSPMPQSPQPGAPSQPAPQPPMNQHPQGGGGPVPPMPIPQQGQGQPPMPPPTAPPAQQGSPYGGMPSWGAHPQPPQMQGQGGAPMGMGQPSSPMQMPQQGGMQGGMFSLQDVVGQIRKANPQLDPSKPGDARIIAEAAGRALPFMRQADQEYYKQMTLGLQQQRADTSRDQGQQRNDISQERANTARDQGFMRIQQTSEKIMATAKMRHDNLALNQSRLEEVKRKGDTAQQRLIEDQIKNDRTAKAQMVNSVSNLLRSASPEQLKDPAYKADMDALQQQLAELKADPVSRAAPAPAGASKGPKSEDAVPKENKISAAVLPKTGEVVNGFKYTGKSLNQEDAADKSKWVPAGG